MQIEAFGKIIVICREVGGSGGVGMILEVVNKRVCLQLP